MSPKNIPPLLVLLLALVLGTPNAFSATGNAVDRINFGDMVSEGVHNFMPDTAQSDMPVQGTGAYGQTFREPYGSGNNSPSGSQVLTFTMTCDPVRQNYLSVKLWGNDANCQMYLLNAPANYPNIDTSGGAPVFPNRFFYYTIPIPLSWTQGQNSVQLTLLFVSWYDRYGGTGINYLAQGTMTRPVYSAFTHTDPCFAPDSADVVGSAPARTGTATLTALTSGSAIAILQANRQALFASGTGYIDSVIARQVTSGTTASSSAPPKEVIGLDLFSTYSTWTSGTSDDAWRNKIANTKAGAGYTAFPDELLTVLCTAYLTPPFVGTSGTVAGLDRYHDATLIPKIVAAIDASSYQQDSDGGFIQQGSEWTGLTSTPRTTGTYVGSTARQITYHGGGDLQGIDTYALGWTIINLLNDSSGSAALQTYLSQSYDADLNGGSMLRAYAWERMLFNAINFYAYGTGGAHSQNMFQMLALYASQIALQKLQALFPNSSYVVSSSTYNSGNYLGSATPLQAAQMVMGLYPDTLRGIGKDNSGNAPPVTNYGMTRKGFGEAHGSLSCGFDGGYGQMLPWLGVRFAQLAAWDPNVDGTTLANFKAQAHATINAWDQFISPLDSTSAVTSGTVSISTVNLAQENFITYRNTENPNWDAATMNVNTQFMASDPNGVLNNAYALRSAYLQTQYGLVPTIKINSGVANEKGSNNSLQFTRDLMAYENSIRSLIGVSPSSLTALPGEMGQPDYAWADVQAGAVVVVNNGERLFLNANWRNYEWNNNSLLNMAPNHVARVHYTTPTIERAATVYLPYNSATIQSDANLSGTTLLATTAVRYGNYLVVLNDGTTSYTAALPSGYGQARELISGSSYNLGSSVAVSASNAAIFWLAASSSMSSGTGAPTIATAAAASPSTVSGTTTNLTVLGADDGGESGLSYTWSLAGTPPGPVAFSANGTNAAKNTTATFSTAGSYTFVVVAKDTGGLTVSSTVAVQVNQTLKGVGITPNAPKLLSGQTQEFFAYGYDQFNQPFEAAQAFTWSLASGVGSLNPVGVYAAPAATGGTASIVVTSGTWNASTTVTVRPPVGVFAGAQDVGSPTVSGTASYASGTYTVKGAGTDIWGAADQFQFVCQTLAGDGTITARVASMTNTDGWAKAGVMFRDSLDADSPYAAAFLTPSNGASFQYRSAYSGNAATNSTTVGLAAPYWVRLTRAGDTFTAYISSDGSAWAQLGTTLTISMADTIYVGLIVGSHNTSSLCTAAFDNVSVTQPARTIFPSDKNIGTDDPGTYLESGTTVTMSVQSGDLWYASDSFRFAWKGINGDGTITARVVSETNTNAWAKAGVMVRKSTDRGSAHNLMLVTPSTAQGVAFQWRDSDNEDQSVGTHSSSLAGGSYAPPYWVRLVRSGDTLAGYHSPDGVTWTQQGTTQTITAANTTMLFGLALAANNNSSTCTAVYDNITVTGTLNTAPMIAAQPTASIYNLTGALSMLGTDDAGESNLTYTWYVLGVPPGNLSFSDNGTNSAKNVSVSFGASGIYYLQATVRDAGGLAVDSNIIQVAAGTVTAPFAPANLTATGGTNSATLAWNAANGATSYNVKRSTTSGTGYSTVATNVTSLTFTDTGLANGTAYYYVVSAVNSAGESANSSQASATPNAPLPSPWVNVDIGSPATAGTSSYGGGSSFIVQGAGSDISASSDQCQFAYVSTNSGSFSVIGRALTPLSFPSTKVAAMVRRSTSSGARVIVVVLEPTGSGSGTYQARFAYRSATNGTLTYSGTVTGLTLPQWLKVDCSTSNSFTGYVSSNGTSWTTVGTASGFSMYSGGVTEAGLALCSRVTGSLATETFDNVSVPGWSAPPDFPTGLTASGSNGVVALGWNAVSGATSYRIKRSTTNGSGFAVISGGTTSATTFNDTSVSNGTTYYYRVSALNANGESSDSAQASATPVAPPVAPGNLVATGTNAAVALSWGAVAGASTYTVKRSLTSGSGYSTVVSGLAGTSYTNTGLTNGLTYYYMVSASNAGGEGANSSQVSATTIAPPSAPGGLTATGTNSAVNLTWNAVSGASSYTLRRSLTSGTGYANVTTISGTSYSDTGLTNGTTYYYVVAASNSGGASDDSAQASAAPVAPPAPPENLVGMSGFALATLSWSPSSGANAYTIKRSLTSGTNYLTLATNLTGTSYADSTVTNATTYYYLVTASNGGGEGSNSNETSVTPVSTVYWGNSLSGTQNWNLTANWLNAGTFPNASGVTAIVNTNITADQTINITQGITVGSLSIGDPDGSNAFTLASGSGAGLTFQNGGSAASLVQLASGKSTIVAANLTLADNLLLTNNSINSPLTVAGAISESGSGRTLTVSGGGGVVLAGSNTYTGATTVSSGTAVLGVSTSGTSGAFGGQNNTLVISGSAVVDLHGFNLANAAVSGTGSIVNTGSAATWTVGNNNGAANLNNITVSGSTTLAINGTGWPNVTNLGLVNSHTGGTRFSGNGATAASAPANRWQVASGFGSGPVTFAGNGGFFVPSSGVAGFTSWTNPVVVSGTGPNAINYDTAVTSSGTWSGTGTMMLVNGHTNTFTLGGNLTGFQGTLLLNGGGGFVSLSNTSSVGAPQAVIDMVASTGAVTLQWAGGASRLIPIGDLNTLGYSGTNAVTLRNNSSSTTGTFQVGGLNLTSTFAGSIVNGPGTVALVKSGLGTWTLTGSNSYSGGTTISSGILLANNTTGSALGTGAVTVATGATLGGNGAIGGAVTVNGTLSPGVADSGTLTVNSSLTVTGSGALQYGLGTNTGLALVNGNLTLGGTLNVTDSGGMTSGTYRLINYTGTLTNNGLAMGTTPSSSYTYQLDTSAAGHVNLVVSQIVIPSAPASFTATGGDAQVSLAWATVSGAANYNVKRSLTTGSGYSTITTTSATSYSDTGLQNGTTYYYLVTASNTAAESAPSIEALARPSAPITLAEKSAVTLSMSGTTSMLTVKSSVVGHTYQLQSCDNLASGSWQNVGAAQAGTGADLQMVPPSVSGVAKRFYRIVITP